MIIDCKKNGEIVTMSRKMSSRQRITAMLAVTATTVESECGFSVVDTDSSVVGSLDRVSASPDVVDIVAFFTVDVPSGSSVVVVVVAGCAVMVVGGDSGVVVVGWVVLVVGGDSGVANVVVVGAGDVPSSSTDRADDTPMSESSSDADDANSGDADDANSGVGVRVIGSIVVSGKTGSTAAGVVAGPGPTAPGETGSIAQGVVTGSTDSGVVVVDDAPTVLVASVEVLMVLLLAASVVVAVVVSPILCAVVVAPLGSADAADWVVVC